ncbi:hypothetical protein [Nocardia goodfellowii]|uniref:Uncharacterized protein n=1 Tax=Nocardia goodfellowii TaxID=882446 RepID=A0ABS4QEU6_9NOCA|nr:hypothetical protein [Nocardia goodfellowii]MBP2190197.1 hypothetical protein [Nocardia goodfellowii]
MGKQQNIDEPGNGQAQIDEDADSARPWDPNDSSGQSLPENKVGAHSIPDFRVISEVIPAVGRGQEILVVLFGHAGEFIHGAQLAEFVHLVLAWFAQRPHLPITRCFV